MTNDQKDRHVLAAAIHAEVPIIVTFNLRHFLPEHLKKWGVVALHPERFLIEILRKDRPLVEAKLEQQARDRNRVPGQLLNILRTSVPAFVELFAGGLAGKQ